MFTSYLNFEITIGPPGREGYPVFVHSPGGDASITLSLSNMDANYRLRNDQLARFEVDEAALIELGQILFHSLVSGKVKEVYARTQGMLNSKQGLRMVLNIDAAQKEISAIPWEFLYDPDHGPLALLDVSVVRYIPQQSVVPIMKIDLPMKVLLTAAKSADSPLIEQGLIVIGNVLAEMEDKIQIVVEPQLTAEILQQRLRQEFHIWHFVGEGVSSIGSALSQLILEDVVGGSRPISAIELGIMLNRSKVRLAVLDVGHRVGFATTPFLGLAAALVRAQIPAVVAMQFALPGETKRAFAKEFYQALVEGFPIDACVTEGRKAVMAAAGLGKADWGLPIVYTRARDGVLFDIPIKQVDSAETSLRPVLSLPIRPTTDTNPFVVGPPISKPEQFFGRENVLQRIFSLLKTMPLQNAAIIGVRRSGKTSLLKYLQHITATSSERLRPHQRNDWLLQPENYRWIFIDFQDPRFRHLKVLMSHLLAGMGAGNQEPRDLEHFLELASAHILSRTHRTVVLFDEISTALSYNSELDNTFWEALRSLANNLADGRLAFVLASHQPPTELAQSTGHSSPFFNIFGYTTVLDRLYEDEAREMIASSPISFDRDDINWILEQSGCWPILLQILCRERLHSLQYVDKNVIWREQAMIQVEAIRFQMR
jgi:hypothetical protein